MTAAEWLKAKTTLARMITDETLDRELDDDELDELNQPLSTLTED